MMLQLRRVRQVYIHSPQLKQAAVATDVASSLLARLGFYTFFAMATLIVLVVGLRLDRADLRVPFEYDYDALMILPMVKSTVETGTHWKTERLGAPGVQELYDYPVADHFHFAFIWALGRLTGSAIVAFNLYYLLTYPLTTLTAMAVLRHFGLSVPSAGCGAVLFAFLPYHYLRGEHHLFLAAYYIVPVTLIVALWLCQGRFPFFRREPDGRYHFAPGGRDAWVTIATAALTGSAGAYYAFFACALYACAGVYGWIVTRNWRAVSATLLAIAAVVFFGAVNNAPAFVYQAENGRNSEVRLRAPEEAEFHGLKLVLALLPVPDHQSRFFSGIRTIYDTPWRIAQNENRDTTFGLVGAAGVLGLISVVVLPVRRGWPLGPLAGLVVFAVLLGTVGGFGSAFSLLVYPQIRGYNRISIYIGFLALFAVVWVLDRFLERHPVSLRWAVLTALTAFGVWDQSARPWFRPEVADKRDEVAARFHADAEFFARIEQTIPGGAVFTLPHLRYPEDYSTPLKGGYEHARGFLHTRTVRWSYGAMKNREVDQWQREVAAAPYPEMLRRLVARGFDGLFIDNSGRATVRLVEITDVLGTHTPRVDHLDGEKVFFDLRPFRDRLRQELGTERFADLCRTEAETVRILWLQGFSESEPHSTEEYCHWGGPAGEVVVVNPTARERKLRLEAVLNTNWEKPADLRILGGNVWNDSFPITVHPAAKTWVIVVPPGRHVVRFRCRAPDDAPATDVRQICFRVALFRATELP
ncbi:hypothetical protein [Fimbriiglobus ruber]|uniref:Integral membrane protein n=1 Tax=Fimbriiglobus ruber TaxID=1908690 RepID=A0A225EAG0_9BACT|nr:hypothetical protein [Fimbriiglobus ruber]OWK47016.1 Integral membrane protein [Fimbriiglobus ruber]